MLDNLLSIRLLKAVFLFVSSALHNQSAPVKCAFFNFCVASTIAECGMRSVQVVCLRRGDKGCVVHRADTGETWDVPAVDMATTTGDECLQSLHEKASDRSSAGSDATARPCDSDFGDADVQSDAGASQSAIEASIQAAWAGSLPPLANSAGPADESEKLDGRSRDDTISGSEGGVGARPGWVKDPTGCGNAFCGGFLVGWLEHRDLLTGALYGSVAASFSKCLLDFLVSLLLTNWLLKDLHLTRNCEFLPGFDLPHRANLADFVKPSGVQRYGSGLDHLRVRLTTY